MSISTSLFSPVNWKKELINYIRAKLNSSDPRSRVTETTTTFNGDDSTTKFTLSATQLSYVSPTGVTVDGTTMSYGSEWNIITDPDDSDKGKIEFTTAPATGTNNVSVTYGYGKNWIYPDFPRSDLAISQYPRVAVSMMESPLPGGLGGTQNVLKNRIRISVLYLAEDTRLLDEMSYTLKNNIVQDAKTFYHFRYIQPDASRVLALSEDASGSVVGLNQDFLVDNKFEIVEYS